MKSNIGTAVAKWSRRHFAPVSARFLKNYRLHAKKGGGGGGGDFWGTNMGGRAEGARRRSARVRKATPPWKFGRKVQRHFPASVNEGITRPWYSEL